MRKRMTLVVGAAAFVAVAAAGTQTPLARTTAGGRPMVIPGCTAELAGQMRDPESLEVDLDSESGADPVTPLEPPHKGWSIVGEYRARNGFGGMNSDIFFCTTDEHGAVDELVTGESLDD